MKKMFLLCICIVSSIFMCSCSDVKNDSAPLDSAPTSAETVSPAATITSEPERIAFSDDTLEVHVGETVALLVDSNVEQSKLEFASSDESVAKYFGGEILGKSKGTCSITAKTPSGEVAECVVTVTAKVVNSGSAGKNVTWTYYDDGTLEFSGHGEMEEYYKDTWYQPANVLLPWYSYSTQAKEIVVKQGVSSICAFAFLDARVCTKISIPSSVTKIGHCAFEHVIGLKSLELNYTATSLGGMVFHSCTFTVFYHGSKSYLDTNLKTIQGNNGHAWSDEFKGKFLYLSEGYSPGCWHYVNDVPTPWQ